MRQLDAWAVACGLLLMLTGSLSAQQASEWVVASQVDSMTDKVLYRFVLQGNNPPDALYERPELFMVCRRDGSWLLGASSVLVNQTGIYTDSATAAIRFESLPPVVIPGAGSVRTMVTFSTFEAKLTPSEIRRLVSRTLTARRVRIRVSEGEASHPTWEFSIPGASLEYVRQTIGGACTL